MKTLTALVLTALTLNLVACSDADPIEETSLSTESSLEATPAWREVADDRFATELRAWREVADDRFDSDTSDTAAPCKPKEEPGPANTYFGKRPCKSVRRENVLPTLQIDDLRGGR